MPHVEAPSGSDHQTTCDLCGLFLRRGRITADFAGKTRTFCCLGCRQVFAILLEALDSGDPAEFKETKLYKQCVAAGILPADQADLDRLAQGSAEAGRTPGRPHSLTAESDPSNEATLELNLKVTNMWCPACAWLIDTALKKKPGVRDSRCDFSTDRLGIRYNPVRTSPERIIAEIRKLGYRTAEPGQDQPSMAQKKDFIRFGICAFLTMNVMMLSFALYSGFLIELTADNIAKITWPMMTMAAAVLGYGGSDFFRKALAGLRSLSASMETLIIIGATSAFGLSVYNQLSGSLHTYYDTASMLVTLVLLGKTLESRAKQRVLDDLERFLALMPTKVRICSDEHPYGRYASIGYLVPGDTYRVTSDEIVPADGCVRSGSGTVDEAAITGEPRPIAKFPGDSIRSGARIRHGDFQITARRVGRNSTLGQMIAIIEKTLLTKTPLEGKTDVILKWFVPVILFLAAATGAVCRLTNHSMADAVLRAVTVTVIACPCALGIAIPLARVAGVSLAGRLGILVRDFSAFEKSRRIDTVVFDKTGTLTVGKWTLLDTQIQAPFTPEQALCLAAGLEAHSDHVIAQELRDSAQQKDLQPVRVENLQVYQNGICGTVGGRPAKIGSAEFVAAELANMDLSGPGQSPRDMFLVSWIYLVVDGTLAATFFFGDTLRTGADTVVAQLKASGYHLALISGDGDPTTQAVGRLLGIDASLGEQTPVDKAEFVRRLQAHGRRVAMAGDGINDAAALVQADLSLALYSGGQLGQETADVTLMRGEPSQVIDFLSFAESVDKRIRQNLVFTFAYNLLAIPVAMSGYLNPLVAVCAMLLSSLSVTTNTLMLIRRVRRQT